MTELEEIVIDAYKQGLIDAQDSIAGAFEAIGSLDTVEGKLLLDVSKAIRRLNLIKEDRLHPPKAFRDAGNGE
jgi:hypothetical protein